MQLISKLQLTHMGHSVRPESDLGRKDYTFYVNLMRSQVIYWGAHIGGEVCN